MKLSQKYIKKLAQQLLAQKKHDSGAVGTTTVVLVSGGLAFTFAPAIATAIIGECGRVESGAALTSYSLAAVGGGVLQLVV